MIDVFICDYIRTSIGRYGGGLSSIRTDDLGALPLKALVERNPTMDLAAMDEVIFGCANQAVKTIVTWRVCRYCLQGFPTRCRAQP